MTDAEKIAELVAALQWALDCQEVNKPLPDAWADKARAALAKQFELQAA